MAPFSASIRKMFAKVFTRKSKRGRSPIFTKFRLESLEQRAVPAVFYVSNAGSNSSVGDAAHPWQTIQNAADHVHAGDTVVVRAGTYAGFILGWDFVTAGTAAAPIVFEADPAAAPGSVVINARNAKTPTGIDIEPGCAYVSVQGFTVDGSGGGGIATYPNPGYGIKVDGDHDRVLNNVVKNLDYATAGIHSNGADYTEIVGNTVFAIHAHGVTTMGHGIYIADGTGIVVRGNSIHDNDFVGLHVNGDPNVVSNALIENNVITNNGNNGINADGLQNSIIRNNLITGYSDFGICLYTIDASGPSSGNLIVNNTVVSTVTGAGAALRTRAGSGATGNTVLNNVLLGGGGIGLRLASDSLSGLVSDYNVAGSLVQSDDTGRTQTFAQWQAGGQDTHSFGATLIQLFADALGGDYHLSSGSVAIDKGTTTDAPPTDAEGTTRPSGAGIDIGYDELAVAGSATHFQVSAPSSVTAGSAFTITITALTSSNATDTGYTGTVHFASSDGQATLPSNYTFVASDAGVHAFANVVTLKTTGSQSVTVTDTATSSITGNASVSVSAAVSPPQQQAPSPSQTDVRRYAVGTAQGAQAVVRVYDPQTGGLLVQGFPFGAYTGGVKVATGDVNGDGFSDVVLMAGPGAQNGHVIILSGRNFSVLADYVVGYPGEMNLAVGDVNGDGNADVILSTATDFDYVAVLSGATQNVIAAYSVFGGLRLGVTLAAGDFDGNGKADIIAGTATQYGAAVVVNGLTGQRLALFLLPIPTNGVNVAAGDVNGDGRADVILGFATGMPLVAVYDAASQSLVGGFSAYPGQPVGVRVATVDRNGDGRADIITSFIAPIPVAAIYDGQSFSVLDILLAQTPGIPDSPSGIYVGGA
jgi:hypothetical protein